MPVEVEREKGDVSVKVDLQNASDDVVNGITHNGNGNEKEDSDGSYVFINENDTGSDDSRKKDLKEEENLGDSKDIPKSVVDGINESEVEEHIPGNGHVEEGKVESTKELEEGKLESTKEEVEQGEDSQVGLRDLEKNHEPEGGIIESDSKTDVEGDTEVGPRDLQPEGEIIESDGKADQMEPEKPHLDVDVVSQDVTKHSDEGKDSDLVSAKVSPKDSDVAAVDPASTVDGSESVDDQIGSESVPVENGHSLKEPEVEKVDDAEKVNALDGEVLSESGPVEVIRDIPAEAQTLVVENGNSESESVAVQDVETENGDVDASLADGSVNTHTESQDASELASDQDGKQDVASEVTEVLDAHASEERSDDVVVAKENVSEADSLSHESSETVSTNINGPSDLLDSKTAVSELIENSACGAADETGAVALESEAAPSVEEGSEPHVVAPAIEDGEISREVNVTKTTPVDVCEDTPSEEVSDVKESDIKETSAMNTDEKVESSTKSLDSTEPPLANNDMVKASEEEDSREEKDETSGTTASVASETNTSAEDLKSKVDTSTDTIHTGAQDSVDSQPAENKGGDAADKIDDKVSSTSEIEESQKHVEPASTTESSAPDASEGQTVAVEIEKRPFYFLPRVPRYDDEKLSEQLRHAEDQVEQKTQNRDALRADIQKIRATCKDYDISCKAAMAEERSARKAMHSKRQEIDALQSVISRIKSAASVNDIDLRMQNMEHMIQHETLSLSEEKGLIREIKQLKQLREQISSSMGTKDEVKQALDEKEKTEESLKVLRKELDVLRSELSKVEAITKAAKKKCDEEWEVQSKLQEKFRAADAVRQEAFVHLQDLKKQQREKNKYFFKYRDDSRAASEMALKKDRAALQSLCSDQVENFMDKWNNDEEFRSYYVRCNTRSTYRRLGTLDGRSLGPDEEPSRITYAPRTDKFRTSSDRAEKHETVPPVVQEEKVVKHESSKIENNGKAVAKPAEQKSQNTKSKKTVKPDQPTPVVKELVSAKEEIEKPETKEEEPPKLTKEEEELIKKDEEKRKQKEAAKLKEQQRLEEIAKAKDAMERKKKREEKAKARAVLKAQKEAEEREKEREKKLRKKERRKGVNTSEETTENPIEASETVIETPREIEIPKKHTAEEGQQIKKSHKPASQFLKQNKSKSIPLPLRNRASKRRLKQYMWIGLMVLVVLALFLLGNANLSFSRANLWFI